MTGLMALAVIPLFAETWLPQRAGMQLVQELFKGLAEDDMNGHYISFPGVAGCGEIQDGSLREMRVVGKEETEVCADQEDGQDEKWQSEEVSSEVREVKECSLPEEAFFQLGSLSMSS